MQHWAEHRAVAWVLAAIAFGLAAVSAKPFASSWNDGSRLASVEALVERGSYCIDGTVFLQPEIAPGTTPYDPEKPLLARGTYDKLRINGHWYSDKPPLVSLPLAAAYRGLMTLGLPAPAKRPDVFAWVICVLLSGTGYAVAVGCMWALGKRAGLPPAWRFVWLAAFALATVLPAYTRSANNHIAQLGAVTAICVLLGRIADRVTEGRTAWGSLFATGLITGFAYNLDFGIGPPLVLSVVVVVALRTRGTWPVVCCALPMLGCMIAGHAINFAIGGDWLRPLNMHREYLAWPGSPFNTTMTGVIRPRYVAQFLYVFDLLVGKKGFLTHNPALWLALFTGVLVLKRAGRDRLEILALAAWCAMGWLMYGVLSKNHGGHCVSIRWFLPFLAPGFWLLAKVLVERPEFRRDFLILTACGLVLSASAWKVGTWWPRVVPLYWWTFGASLLAWGAVRWHAERAKGEPRTTLLAAILVWRRPRVSVPASHSHTQTPSAA
jgi:hypothetical protein